MLTRYRSMYLGSSAKFCNWNISYVGRTLSRLRQKQAMQTTQPSHSALGKFKI